MLCGLGIGPDWAVRFYSSKERGDSLCDLDLLKSNIPAIPAPVTLHVIEGGDHSFKTPKSGGKSQQDVWREIGLAITQWIGSNQASLDRPATGSDVKS